jgi:hypothetical protein
MGENTLERVQNTLLNEIDRFDVNALYTGIHVLSDAATKWLREDRGRGWSEAVTTPTGTKAFETEAEQQVVEEFFNAIDDADAAAMAGGAGEETAVEKIKRFAAEHIDPQKISIDLAYMRTTEVLDKMDRDLKDLARQIGLVKFQDTMPAIPLYQFGIPYEITGRTLIPLINGLVEMMRIFATFGPEAVDFLRVPLSVLTAMIDVGRGDWKKGVLSMLGVFGRWPAAIGIFGKILRDLFLFISPDISTEMRDVFYKSTKSFFAGVLFWSFSTFAPEPIYRLVEASFKELGAIIKTINEKVDEAERTLMSQIPDAMKQCYDIQFRRIPEGIIPEFDNLEALQAAFNVPELYCSPAVREQIEKITYIPPIRLMLELLNVPTLKEDFDKRCVGIASENKSMEDAVLEALKPIVRRKAECPLE